MAMPLNSRALRPTTRIGRSVLVMPILLGCSEAEFRYSPDQAVDFRLHAGSGRMFKLVHDIPTPAALAQLPPMQRTSWEGRLLTSYFELVPVNPDHETIPLRKQGFGLRPSDSKQGEPLTLIFEFVARTIADDTIDVRRYILKLVSVDGKTKDSEDNDLFNEANAQFPQNKVVEVVIDNQAPQISFLSQNSQTLTNGFSIIIKIMIQDLSPLAGTFKPDAFSLTGSVTLHSNAVILTNSNDDKSLIFYAIYFTSPTELTGEFTLELDADKHTVRDSASKKTIAFVTNPQMELNAKAAGSLEKIIDWQAWAESLVDWSPNPNENLAVDYGLFDPTTS